MAISTTVPASPAGTARPSATTRSGLRAAAPVWTGRLSVALSVLVLLAIVAAPVEYRAGAKTPHAHAGLQIWWEHAQGDPHDHSTDLITDDGRHEHQAASQAEATAGPSPLAGALAAVAAEASPDLPRVSKLSPVVGSLAVLVVSLALLRLPTLPPRRAPAWPVPLAWVALRSTPETPPPRIVHFGRALLA